MKCTITYPSQQRLFLSWENYIEPTTKIHSRNVVTFIIWVYRKIHRTEMKLNDKLTTKQTKIFALDYGKNRYDNKFKQSDKFKRNAYNIFLFTPLHLKKLVELVVYSHFLLFLPYFHHIYNIYNKYI